MTSILPNWALIVATLLSICVFVAGRVRLALLLATPALLRFVAWPAVLALIGGIPLFVLVSIGVLMLPVIIVRGGRKFLILFVGQEAADHALGHALGKGIVRLFSRPRP